MAVKITEFPIRQEHTAATVKRCCGDVLVLSDVTTDMVITKEETFGPVAPLYRFKTEADAMKMANDTEFGSLHISIAATSAVSGASPKPSNTASSALTRASSRPRSRVRRHEGERHRPPPGGSVGLEIRH